MESPTIMRGLLSLALVLLLAPACGTRDSVRSTIVSPKFEVVSCRFAAGRELVDVKLKVAGPETFRFDPRSTYLVDEATGERFYLVQLRRIGPLAEVTEAGKGAVRSITFRNREGKLRPGASLTLVIGEERLRNMILKE